MVSRRGTLRAYPRRGRVSAPAARADGSALSVTSGLSQELRGLVAGIDDPLRLVYLLSSLLDMKADEKQQILESDTLIAKLQVVATALTARLRSRAQKQDRVGGATGDDDAQRQYYLREQMKAIQDELGEGEKTGGAGTAQTGRGGPTPEHVLAVATREIDRLERMPPVSPSTR